MVRCRSLTAAVAATLASLAFTSSDRAAACDRVAVRTFAARAVTVAPLHVVASPVALGDTSCCGSAVAAAVAPQAAALTVAPLTVAPLAVVPLYAEPLAVPVQVHATNVRAFRTALVRPLVVRPTRVRSVTRVRTAVR